MTQTLSQPEFALQDSGLFLPYPGAPRLHIGMPAQTSPTGSIEGLFHAIAVGIYTTITENSMDVHTYMIL